MRIALLVVLALLAGCTSELKSPEALRLQEAAEAQVFEDWFAHNGQIDGQGRLRGAPYVSSPQRCDDPETPAMLTEFYMRLPQALIDDFKASNPPGSPPVRLATAQGSLLVADSDAAVAEPPSRGRVSRVGFNAARDEALLCWGDTFVVLRREGRWKPVQYIESSHLRRLAETPI
ncbi:hypothetical protein [Tahibacter caeni]|uniref:hypothetical protein n=1 Tax=Tahibacter caeni TaxID=1453545 RepID=UPI00214870D3|nr:hypothetical protein [Tahibacter caeni]